MKITKFLNESTAMRLLRTADLLERKMNTALSHHHLSVMQSLILLSVFFEDGIETRPKELHASFKMSKGNISHCLSHLEELKLVKRINEVADRRGCYVRLTKKGEDLCKKLVGYFNKLEDQLEGASAQVNSHSFLQMLTEIDNTLN